MGGWNFVYLDVWQQESAVFSVDAESLTEILTNLMWTLDISEQYPKIAQYLKLTFMNMNKNDQYLAMGAEYRHKISCEYYLQYEGSKTPSPN